MVIWVRSLSCYDFGAQRDGRASECFFSKSLGFRIEIEMTDGAIHAVDMAEVIGSPAKPLSRERHLEKFRENWKSGAIALEGDSSEQLIDLVDRLEDVENCCEIAKLLAH